MKMNISPSQLSTYRLCPRKWWFGSVKKMRGGSSKAQVFGDVLHKVLERYLTADRLGRDPATGAPVNLYPKDWQHMENRWTGEKLPERNDPQDEAIIRSLVTAAIESGYRVRHEGQVIEKDLDLPVIDADGDLPEVRLRGFVDQDLPDEIIDHKSAGSTRFLRTAKRTGPGSDRYLGDDTAMLCYAYPKTEDFESVKLTHLAFLKDADNPRVIPTTVTVSAEEIREHWKGVQQDAAEMRMFLDVENLKEISDETAKKNSACEAYGGCEYLMACQGLRTQESLQARMTGVTVSVPKRANVVPSAEATQGNKMALAKKFGPGKSPLASPLSDSPPATTVVSKPAEPEPAEPEPAEPEPAEPEPADDYDAPPWAWDDCNGCKGRPGFSKSGDPCKICAANASSYNKREAPDEPHPMAVDYEIEHQGDGLSMWQEVEGEDAGLAWSGVEAAPAVAAKPRVEKEPEPVVEPEPEALAEEEPKPERELTPEEEQMEEALDDAEEMEQEAAELAQLEASAKPVAMKPKPEAPAVSAAIADAKRAQQAKARPAKGTGIAVSLDSAPPEMNEAVEAATGAGPKPPKADPALVERVEGCASATKGRKPSSFDLAINVSVDGSAKLVRGEQVLLRLTEMMTASAIQQGLEVDHFVHLNAFDRRDIITQLTPQIIGGFASGTTVTVTLSSGASDLRSFVEALRPYAATVYEAKVS